MEKNLCYFIDVTKEVKGKGMPFYGDAMSYGNLYIVFNIEFPKKGELKNAEDLKKVFI